MTSRAAKVVRRFCKATGSSFRREAKALKGMPHRRRGHLYNYMRFVTKRVAEASKVVGSPQIALLRQHSEETLHY